MSPRAETPVSASSAERLRADLMRALSDIVPVESHGPELSISDAKWRRVLEPYCQDARSLRLPIELIITTCKEAWQSLPTVRPLAHEERDRLMSRLVTLCIETYFAFPNSPDTV
jgi:hypothetical protein